MWDVCPAVLSRSGIILRRYRRESAQVVEAGWRHKALISPRIETLVLSSQAAHVEAPIITNRFKRYCACLGVCSKRKCDVVLITTSKGAYALLIGLAASICAYSESFFQLNCLSFSFIFGLSGLCGLSLYSEGHEIWFEIDTSLVGSSDAS